MQLLTKEIKKRLPKLYTNEDTPLKEQLVVCKFFSPVGAYTFYALEGEQEEDDWRFYGFATGVDYPEFGYVMLSELETVRLPLGLKIERDIYFKPIKIADIPGIMKCLKEE